MLSRPTLDNTFRTVSRGTFRLGFLHIRDALTLAITPNGMVPTVIQKIGMKPIVVTEAVSLLPVSPEPAF